MSTPVLPSDRHMGFSSAESLGRLLTLLLWKFWRLCGAAILILILVYWMYGGAIILILLIITMIGGLYHYQDSLLYYPEQPESARVFVQTPSSVGLPYENIYLTTKDGCRIIAYFIKQPQGIISTTPTVLYFHGNAGNIGHRLHNAQALYRHCGFNVLLLEYRGYGKSQGTPSELGLYLDAQAGLDFLISRRDIDNKKIILFGRSLGGAVAISLAASHPHKESVMALVIENTFTSIPKMAQLMFPGASSFPLLCFKNKFLNCYEIRKVRVPTLLLSGLSDQLIPPRMMMELYQACGSPLKHLETFNGGTHNGTWTCYGYYEHLNKFINYLVRIQESSADNTSSQDSVVLTTNSNGTQLQSAVAWSNR